VQVPVACFSSLVLTFLNILYVRVFFKVNSGVFLHNRVSTLAGTQISGSGSSSAHRNLLAPAPEQFGPKDQKKTLHYLYNSLARQTISVDPEPKFQTPVPPSIRFWLRLQPSKIASAPALQPCCVLGSFILARVGRLFMVRLKLFSERELSIGLEIQCFMQIHRFRNIQFDRNYIFKTLNCIGQLGETERKIYEQRQGPKQRCRVNNLVKWDRGWRHKHTKQACVSSI